MSEWTPEMSAQVRLAADQILEEGNPVRAFLLHQMVGAIESQRAELEAASRYIAVLQCQRNAYLTIEEERELMYAQAAYEDLRSQHATSGKDAE